MSRRHRAEKREVNPDPKFNDLIERLREQMASVSIVAPSPFSMHTESAFYEPAAAIAM